MSDFLSHLASRTLEPRQVLQPRPASRFEPAPVTLGLHLGDRLPDEPLVEQTESLSPTLSFRHTPWSPVSVTGPTASELNPIFQPEAPPPTSFKSSLPEQPTSLAAPSFQPVSGLTLVPEPRNRPADQSIQPTIAPLRSQPLLPHPVPTTPAGGASPVYQAHERLAQAGALGDVTRAELAVLLHRLQHLESGTGNEPGEQNSQLSPTAMRPQPSEAPSASPSLPLLKPDSPALNPPLAPPLRPSPIPPMISPPQPDKPAAPTIQVTIGRIEVRATPPPPPAKKSAPATPQLSLETYLRQRNGGRR